ncbi:MAG: histidinol dehydrogenase, partial [Deltaproteobacteria bacterium]|nr:histidinol dehydrogenase [Deltaproteobacteria bacterium]
MKWYHIADKTAEKRIEEIVHRGLRIRKKDLAAVEKILADVKRNG